ncbi:E3 ubiquitin-protein ligase UBR1 [Trichinella spiralis]|uniref:E3 ubiquitin-protein ligase n=1 Tax=Trichinella spiralis TaxID=6334 RepID=A0A0V1C2V8_TRISP|nr:E3 ubiquitin-protein ligase UBR1 [Trichinella spiralis]
MSKELPDMSSFQYPWVTQDGIDDKLFVEDMIRESCNMANMPDFKTKLCYFFSVVSSKVFTLTADPETPEVDETLLKKRVFDLLTNIFCGSYGRDFQAYAAYLHYPCITESNKCNRQLICGEPTYCCLDCACDQTCIFCHACFQSSEHKNHRYSMSTSEGSGTCDCGDKEAWKSNYYCLNHKPVASFEPSKVLLEEGSNRCLMLINAMLSYIRDVLQHAMFLDLPTSYYLDSIKVPHAIVMFNDEVHSYEDVISTLSSALDIDTTCARLLSARIDRDGCSVVFCGSQNSCDYRKQMIYENQINSFVGPLISRVADGRLVLHQMMAVKLLQWLGSDVCSQFPILESLFCQALLNVKSPTDVVLRNCFANSMLIEERKLWKGARIAVQQLIMCTLTKDETYRQTFACEFINIYEDLHLNYVNDDHAHSVCAVSLAVQIFTTPSIARMLIRKKNALKVVATTAVKLTSSWIRDDRVFKFVDTEQRGNIKRVVSMFEDFRYLLNSLPTQLDEFDKELLQGVTIGYGGFLELLARMDGMDAMIRILNESTRYELLWECGFTVFLSLAPAMKYFAKWAFANVSEICSRRLATEFFLQTRFQMSLFHLRSNDTAVSYKIGGKVEECIPYDSTKDPVSFHIPTLRMLCTLFTALMEHNVSKQEWMVLPVSHSPPCEWYEYPLRILSAVAQYNAGMWFRNHRPIAYSYQYYTHPVTRSSMFQKDVVMLQVAGSLMHSADKLLIQALVKFDLCNWAKLMSKADEMSQFSSGRQRLHTVLVAEDYLQLFIMILGERWTRGVGEVKKDDALRRLVVQMLCQRPATFSAIDDFLGRDGSEDAFLEDILSSVANFQESASSRESIFSLKSELLPEYNKFNWFYTKKMSFDSYEYQQTLRTDQPLDMQACPPPMAPKFKPAFVNLLSIYASDTMILILQLILRRKLLSLPLHSDGQLERAIFLIGMALNDEFRQWQEYRPPSEGEQVDSTNQINFTDNALSTTMDGMNLLQMMEKLVGDVIPSIDLLLKWAIARFKAVDALKKFKKEGKHLDEEYAFLIEEQYPDESSPDEVTKEEERRKQRHKNAMRHRQNAMLTMKNLSNQFVDKNQDMLVAHAKNSIEEDDVSFELRKLSKEEFPVAIGPDQSETKILESCTAQCVVCLETTSLSDSSDSVVFPMFMQLSRIFCNVYERKVENKYNWKYPLYVPFELNYGLYANACGHPLHFTCFKEACLRMMLRNRTNSDRYPLFRAKRNEFFCSVCKRVSNGVLPLLSPMTMLTSEKWLSGKELQLRWFNFMSSVYHFTEISNDEINLKDYFQAEGYDVVVNGTAIASSDELLNNIREGALMRVALEKGVSASDERTVAVWSLRWFSWKANNSCQGPVEPRNDRNALFIVAATVAYTLRSLEHELQLERKPLFGAFSKRQCCTLYTLTNSVMLYAWVTPAPQMKIALNEVLQPWFSPSESFTILDIDLFTSLVQVILFPAFCFPTDVHDMRPIPTFGYFEHQTFLMVFTGYLLQALWSTCNLPSSQLEEITAEQKQSICHLECDAYVQLSKMFYNIASMDSPLSNFEQAELFKRFCTFKEYVRKFLRLSALFFNALTRIVPPEALRNYNVDDFQPLCRYLGLPENMVDLMKLVNAKMMESWFSGETLAQKFVNSRPENQKHEKACALPIRPQSLFQLPAAYVELLVKVSKANCPSLKRGCLSPALCLICGEVLCYRSHCCRHSITREESVGAVCFHSFKCSGGTGLFLNVRSCQVIMLYDRFQGCLLDGPYRDKFGEHDLFYRRGKPLTLREDKYEALKKIWYFHNVPEKITSSDEAHHLSISWTFFVPLSWRETTEKQENKPLTNHRMQRLGEKTNVQ